MTATVAARTIALDEWVAVHGPLWPAAALVVALKVCARASSMTDTELSRTIGSLNAASIVRDDAGGWSWLPRDTGSTTHRVSDSDVIERIGALVCLSVTGQTPTYPFAGDAALRGTLRRLRPNLPAAIVALTVSALSARRSEVVTLAAFARELRQAVGVEQRARRSPDRRRVVVGAAAVALVLSIGSGWAVSSQAGRQRPEPNGLTKRENVLFDVSNETAQTLAIIDEHTAAIVQYQQILRLWRTRIAPGDPRLAWYESHEAWVRMLAGDRLSAEQLLQDKPAWLGAALGDGHPYTRTVRLALAATLDARGATFEATALRAAAERATRNLLQNTGLASSDLDSAPFPAGVHAHVSPNVAEREGFRRGPDGEWSVPLTSVERWLAAREGWRLHVVPAGPCRASVDLGGGPRVTTVTVVGEPDRRWQILTNGLRSTVLPETAESAAGITIIVTSSGDLEGIVAGRRARLAENQATGTLPNPPHRLAFQGGPGGNACALVWLEIPFPSTPGASQQAIPVSK